MIYEVVSPDAPIQQGDILFPIPMIEPPQLDSVELLSEDGVVSCKWLSVTQDGSGDKIIATKINPVWGIVATQNCDAIRAPEISCFFIGEFYSVTCLNKPTTPEKGIKEIVSQTQRNNKWFYLPPDSEIGFTQPMAANFLRIFQLDRDSLEKDIAVLRKGRLNSIAYEHYRECISQHFRRYSFNPWYPLSQGEFESYRDGIKDEHEKAAMLPYDWQKNTTL